MTNPGLRLVLRPARARAGAPFASESGGQA